MLIDNPQTLYVFGDNMVGQGFGGQAKEMRGAQNAVGIPTKNYPGSNEQDYFSDNDFIVAKAKIDKAFMQLICHAQGGGKIVWPEDGIGTGLANLRNRAKSIWNYIEKKRKALERITSE